MRLPFLVGSLLCVASASAQITPLGGGVSPLFVSGSPTRGSTLQISPLPSTYPAVFLGITRGNLSMTAVGAGCGDVLIPQADIFSPVTLALAIPNDPNLVGFPIYAQGVLGGVPPCFLAGVYFQLTQAIEIRIQ
ncbi:MAG: hypothetical protein KDE27_16855 [Planctomycetes bacterium]|nr:hypothetical protein [Planctomycetota bacterium]